MVGTRSEKWPPGCDVDGIVRAIAGIIEMAKVDSPAAGSARAAAGEKKGGGEGAGGIIAQRGPPGGWREALTPSGRRQFNCRPMVSGGGGRVRVTGPGRGTRRAIAAEWRHISILTASRC